jgi:integrase
MQAVNRLFVLAVYPAKLLAANPLPKGFLPKNDASKAKSYVYPDEDAKLFYGILAREGFRVSELRLLMWANVDLEHGSVRLDENKTTSRGRRRSIRASSRHCAAGRSTSRGAKRAQAHPAHRRG